MRDTNNRISMKDPRQFKMFTDAMNTLRENKLELSDYDAKLFQDLDDALDMFGNSIAVTRKQFNHIRQVAWDFERGA